jgi:hypothetical protein
MDCWVRTRLFMCDCWRICHRMAFYGLETEEVCEWDVTLSFGIEMCCLCIRELRTGSPLAVAGFSMSSWFKSWDPEEPSKSPSRATLSRWGCSVSVSVSAAVSTSVKPQKLLSVTSVLYIESSFLWERQISRGADFAFKYLITLSSAHWCALPVLKYYNIKTQGNMYGYFMIHLRDLFLT